MSTPVLDVRGLAYAYPDGHQALYGVDLHVHRGERVALLGPNGAGKTTLVHHLNGILTAGAGTVTVSGLPVTREHLPEIRRRVGVVFQDPDDQLFMPTVRDDVAFGPANLGVRGAALDERVERALEQAALWDEVKDRLSAGALSLSGGQQQRLCIARAIAVEPDVLLMDEPASALDPISTLAIEDLMAELKERFTIVIVTHNMQQAARVSEQTGFFNLAGVGQPGQLIEFNSTEKIFSNPDQKATEDYISGRFG